jgi:putative peptidoglycan lipid II flippase
MSRSMSRDGAINMGVSLLAAALTYLSLALIARKFGGSAGSDAYFFLLSLTTVSTALIGGVFSAVLLPQFVDIRVREGLNQVSQLASIIFVWTLLLCLVLAVVVWLNHDNFFSVASRFDKAKLQEQRSILVWLGPVFFFSVLSEYLKLVLMGIGRFIGAAFSSLLSPLFLIAVLLFSDSIHEDSLAIALGVSRVLVVLLMLMLVLRAGVVLRFRLAGSKVGMQFVRVSAPYAAAGLVTNFASFFFDYMATGLGVGVLTAVTYAQRVYAMPLALVITPFLDVVRVRLAEYRATGNMAAFQRLYNRLAHITIYIALPMGAVLFTFAHDIIAMLFQRGSLSVKEVEIAAASLQVMACSVPLTCFFTLNGRVIELFGRLGWPALLGTAGHLGLVLLTYHQVEKYGFIGIAYSRLWIDLMYFLPLGLVLVQIRGVSIGFSLLLRALGLGSFACAIPAAAYMLLVHQLPLIALPAPWWLAIGMMLIWLLLYGALVLAADGELRTSIIERLHKEPLS